MATMMKQSKIICYHDELQAALNAALKVADKKNFGSIQFRPIPEDEVIQISALNPTSTFMATVPTEMCDVVEGRDEVFECLLSEASVMARFPIKMPKGSDGEVPKAGLIIAESWIQITDETGLGVGIRHTRIRRNSEVELPGTPARTIESALDAQEDLGAMLYPAQTALVGKVAEIMGQKHRIRCVESPDGVLSRVLLTGTMYGLTVTEGQEQTSEGSAPDDKPLSFDDAEPQDYDVPMFDVDEEEDTDTTPAPDPGLRIVGARPMGGAS